MTESTTTNPRGFEVVLQRVKADLVIWAVIKLRRDSRGSVSKRVTGVHNKKR